MALLGCQETYPLFQDTFSVLLSNPSVGKPQKGCVGKGWTYAQPTVPLALHLQMSAKGESGWNMLVPAYPQLEAGLKALWGDHTTSYRQASDSKMASTLTGHCLGNPPYPSTKTADIRLALISSSLF